MSPMQNTPRSQISSVHYAMDSHEFPQHFAELGQIMPTQNATESKYFAIVYTIDSNLCTAFSSEEPK
jgi:hypothetical protein